jgi:hypothetical protein
MKEDRPQRTEDRRKTENKECFFLLTTGSWLLTTDY